MLVVMPNGNANPGLFGYIGVFSAGIRNDEKGSGPLTRTRNRKYHEFLEGRGA